MGLVMRLSSALVRRFTRIWAARLDTTSPDTTAISPERRVSRSLTSEVTRYMEVVKDLRASDTCLAAWRRALAMFFTVREKRASARAACLARRWALAMAVLRVVRTVTWRAAGAALAPRIAAEAFLRILLAYAAMLRLVLLIFLAVSDLRASMERLRTEAARLFLASAAAERTAKSISLRPM